MLQTLRRSLTVCLLVAGCQSTAPQNSLVLSDIKTMGPDFTYCTVGDCSITNSAKLQNDLGVPIAVHHECGAPDQYAMTFDDAPSEYLPTILEILNKEGVKATIFVIGRKVDTPAKRALLKAAFDQGHQISNHSFTHPDLTKLTRAQVQEEARKSRDTILAAVGRDARSVRDASILRPPYGLINFDVQAALADAGFTTLRWNADRADWSLSEKDLDLVLFRVKQQLDLVKEKAGTGINTSLLDLNHDYSHVTTMALPKMIDMIRKQGYRFVTLSECLRRD